tara:strand:- start:274 stop:537 length:264 start_codon:yes stop_codon:yes gene_type:complete
MNKQSIITSILDLFGNLYLLIEKHMNYPHDDVIMSLKIDDKLQKMNRQQLCDFMDETSGSKGFYELPSTTKIRYGCQLLKNYTDNKA